MLIISVAKAFDYAKWAKGTRVVDSKGKPIPVYHGSQRKFAKFNTDPSRQLGAHFGSYEQATDRDPLVVYKVWLRLKNPYNMLSDLGDWADMGMLEEYLGPNNGEVFTDEEFRKFKTATDVVFALKALGYDGMTYENSFEAGGDSGESYIVFDAKNIKIESVKAKKWINGDRMLIRDPENSNFFNLGTVVSMRGLTVKVKYDNGKTGSINLNKDNIIEANKKTNPNRIITNKLDSYTK